MSTSGEIVVQARRHSSGRWITLPLLVGGVRALSAVLDTGSPVSAISPRTEAALLESGLLQPGAEPNRYRLADLSASNQPLPALEVGVVRRLDPLDIDGLLGLDFLMQFEHIHFHTRSLELVLEPT